MKKSILIIGGTGFLGQSFFDCLDKGYLNKLNLSKIIIISRKRKTIKSKFKISFIKKNITDIKKIPVTDYIIYAANSSRNSENLKGIYNFKKLLNKNHKKTKILFTSSGAVYGESKTKKKFKESDLISLKNVSSFKGYKVGYAKSKILMENEFKKLGKNGFNVSIGRLFTFIGKRIMINKNLAVTNLVNQAKNKKINLITFDTSKDVYRSYMNSKDLIRWLIKILLNASKKCNIFNVGSDEVITIENLAKMIGKKFNKKIQNSSDLKKNKPKVVDFYVPSIARSKKILKLEIKYNLKQSLSSLLADEI